MIWKYYYSLNSSSQHGTLYQLRNLIGRTNVKGKPIDCFDPCEDFFVLIVEAYIVAVAMKLLKLHNLSDVPSEEYATHGDVTWTLTAEERSPILEKITKSIIDKFMSINYNAPNAPSASSDKVYLYSSQLLTLGSIYLEFRDAIKEGDGSRVLRCYRYLLPMFISSGKKNYAIESLNLLLQHDYLLSPREVEELTWSRFINTHGQTGKNIPCDLHCEHLNRLCKTSITNLQANKTTNSMCRVARALGTIYPVLDNFDKGNNVTKSSSTHREPNSSEDFKAVLDCLNRFDVFNDSHSRKHQSFPKPRDPLHAKLHEDIVAWIKDHIKYYVDSSCT